MPDTRYWILDVCVLGVGIWDLAATAATTATATADETRHYEGGTTEAIYFWLLHIIDGHAPLRFARNDGYFPANATATCHTSTSSV